MFTTSSATFHMQKPDIFEPSFAQKAVWMASAKSWNVLKPMASAASEKVWENRQQYKSENKESTQSRSIMKYPRPYLPNWYSLAVPHDEIAKWVVKRCRFEDSREILPTSRGIEMDWDVFTNNLPAWDASLGQLLICPWILTGGLMFFICLCWLRLTAHGNASTWPNGRQDRWTHHGSFGFLQLQEFPTWLQHQSCKATTQVGGSTD